MRTTTRHTAIKVRLESDTKRRLQAEAQIEGLDLSDVVRRAISQYFAHRSIHMRARAA